jgi:ComF family protein
MMAWRALWQRAVQLLLPTHCAVCQQLCLDPLCAACAAQLDYIGDYRCVRCGRKRQTTFYSPDCGECYGQRLGIQRARSALVYSAVGRQLLHAYKFQGVTGAGQVLGGQLAGLLQPGWAKLYAEPELVVGYVIPVPLHAKRRRRRGFNQAELLAYRVAQAARTPCRPELLARITDTPSQVGLSANQRRVNVQGAFAVPERWQAAVAGQTCVVVDDLMTTGATLAACARALKAAKAKVVYGLTVFSTVRDVEPAEYPDFED